MTRINLVAPSLLLDQHLGAEYRELPRIFGLVRAAALRGETPQDPRNPVNYTLGSGHCRFFYPRLGFLKARYEELVAECKARGRWVRPYATAIDVGIGSEWFGDWRPDEEAMMLSMSRLNERGGLRVAPKFQTKARSA